MYIREMLREIGLTEPYRDFDMTGRALDLQGWNSTHPYFARFIDEVRPKEIIEVGSWKGGSAIHMAELCTKQHIDSTILCVDTWLGSNEILWRNSSLRQMLLLQNGYPHVHGQFLANVILSGFQDNIFALPMTSLSAAELLQAFEITADLIYIDAGHGEYEVYGDVSHYWRLLRVGGVMIGDDYHHTWPGVVRAVNRFASDTKMELIASGDGKWAMLKRE
jgi:predicted O-methyltransferase YrrM